MKKIGRDDWGWLSPFELLVAVILLCILPFIDRETARALGPWVFIAPALAALLVCLAWLQLAWARFEEDAYRSAKLTKRLARAFLAILLLAIGLTFWEDVYWIANGPKQAVPEKMTSNLKDALKEKGVQQFGKAMGGSITASPNLKLMNPDIRSTLGAAKCKAVSYKKNPGFIKKFQCDMSSDIATQRPQCRFVWKLKPIHEAGNNLAIVSNRRDVVSKFPSSGYGKWGLSGKPISKAPYVGVAFVACAADKLRKSQKNWNLHVAFVLSTAEEIENYKSTFRTVGFDWITPQHFARPYQAEIFALTSLYRVTQLIYSGKPPLQQTVTSSKQADLFDVEQLKALRKIPPSEIRVGNNSDWQLGNSRGSCLLAAAASGFTGSSGTELHVAPSVVTPIMSKADRSLVLIPAGGEPISLPCTLFSALITRNMSSASNYPPALTGKLVRYYHSPGESMEESVRSGYATRAAGLTLYLLGFSVKYNPNRSTTHVTGKWPREEFITGTSAPTRP